MDLDLSSLESAVDALGRAHGVAANPIVWNALAPDIKEAVQSGVIQCFEVAYEQCWKMMQRWLEVNRSPSDLAGATRRHLYRLAAESALIADVELWMAFNKARNQTSHTYDSDVALAVFEIAGPFLSQARQLVAALQAKHD